MKTVNLLIMLAAIASSAAAAMPVAASSSSCLTTVLDGSDHQDLRARPLSRAVCWHPPGQGHRAIPPVGVSTPLRSPNASLNTSPNALPNAPSNAPCGYDKSNYESHTGKLLGCAVRNNLQKSLRNPDNQIFYGY